MDETDSPAGKPAPLFRKEALTSRTSQGADIILPVSRTNVIVVGLFALLTLGALALIAFSTYTRKAHVAGVLLPSGGLVRVTAMQGGIVLSRSVDEGRKVQAGDILFTLTSERPSSGMASVEATISGTLEARRRSLEAEEAQKQAQFASRIHSARQRAADHMRDATRLEEQIRIQSQRVAVSDSILERQIALRKSGFVSEAQVQDRQAEALDQRQRSGDLERLLAATRRSALELTEEVRQLQFQAQREAEATKRSLAMLDQERVETDAQRDFGIRSPRGGVVAAVLAQSGEPIVPNQVLATIVPFEAPLEAELLAPSSALGFIEPGMKVLLRYQAFPHQKFGQADGEVSEVSLAPVRVGDARASSPQAASGESAYRIRVRLKKQTITAYGKELPLRPGMSVDASISLDTRYLYEWLLEPLFSLRGKG